MSFEVQRYLTMPMAPLGGSMGLAHSDAVLEESGSQMFSYTASRALGHSDDAGALPTASGRQCAQGPRIQCTRKRSF